MKLLSLIASIFSSFLNLPSIVFRGYLSFSPTAISLIRSNKFLEWFVLLKSGRWHANECSTCNSFYDETPKPACQILREFQGLNFKNFKQTCTAISSFYLGHAWLIFFFISSKCVRGLYIYLRGRLAGLRLLIKTPDRPGDYIL